MGGIEDDGSHVRPTASSMNSTCCTRERLRWHVAEGACCRRRASACGRARSSNGMPGGNAGGRIVRWAGPGSSRLTGKLMSSTASNGHRLRIADPNRSDGSAPTAAGSGSEPTELPVPVARRMLGDPTRGVRMAIVLPYLLKTHDVRRPTRPSHVTISRRRSGHPGTDQRIDVELHNPQRTAQPTCIPPPDGEIWRTVLPWFAARRGSGGWSLECPARAGVGVAGLSERRAPGSGHRVRTSAVRGPEGSWGRDSRAAGLVPVPVHLAADRTGSAGSR